MSWINGHTQKIAILGHPIGHTLSPQMHNHGFVAQGLNYVYVPCNVSQGHLEEACKGLWALGFKGANVTIPHKEAILPYCVDLSDKARLIGAVNTLIRTEGGFRGHNTDGDGFLQALIHKTHWQPQGQKVVVLGAGGAARAISLTLACAGVGELTLVNRTLSKAQAIVQSCHREDVARLCQGSIPNMQALGFDDADLGSIIQAANIIINATSLGMAPDIDQMLPIDPNWLTPAHTVVDLVYNPRATRFLRCAQAQGCQVVDGLGMLLFQGALAYELWTGHKPPVEEMYHQLTKHLEG